MPNKKHKTSPSEQVGIKRWSSVTYSATAVVAVIFGTLLRIWADSDGGSTPTSPKSAWGDGLASILRNSTFMREHYERRHAFMSSAMPEADLHALAGVDMRIFSRLGAATPAGTRSLYETVADGRRVPLMGNVRGAADINAGTAVAAVAGGGVIVNRMEDGDAAVSRMVNAMFAVLGVRPHVNMYASPPATTGLRAHHDPQDVFIVQVSGGKHWRVCDPIGAGKALPTRVSENPSHPLYHLYPDAVLNTALAAGETRCTKYYLSPGDILYLPRGTIHAPSTAAEPSVHLTVGLDSDFTWADYVKGLRAGGHADDAQTQELARCLPQRDLNKLVPHELLLGIDDAGAAATSAPVPKAAVTAFLRAFETLDWSSCGSHPHGEQLLSLLRCVHCAETTMLLMRRLQRRARAAEPRRWDF